MLIQYDGIHSIDFFDDRQKSGTYKVINSWRDLHLIPTKKPYIAMPKPNFNIVEVPYSNVVLDLTNYQTGSPTHSLREGEWEFIVDADAWGGSDNAYNFLLKQFHGRRFYCELTDDPGKLYLGRYEISSFESGEYYPTVKIKYILEPKLSVVQEYDEGTPVYGEVTIDEITVETEPEWTIIYDVEDVD